MLRITTSHSAEGAKKYFDVSLKTSDYYTRDIGTWGGRGAEILGLKGAVERKDFVALVNNRWPGANGERLTARMNKARLEDVKDKKTGIPILDTETGQPITTQVSNRRAGYDFTFSVPKSVSLYLAVNEDKVIEQVIAEALDETMATIEARMETKVRKGYQHDNRVSPNMVYAKFVHGESRPVDGIPDPHYHIHVFAMNATFDEVEKEWKALEVGNTVGDRTFYEAQFHHLLAAKLDLSGYGIRRTEQHFEFASVSRELVEKFSRRTELIEQRARDKYKVLEAEARALMKSTNMAFDDAFAHVIAEIGGDWDKWKSNLGARNRESKSSAKYKARQELVAHWQSEMTPQERESLQPERVKSAPSQNLLGVGAAKALAIQHLFEQVSLKRELHIAGMLLRRGIARVGIAEALAWANSDPIFVRPDLEGKLLTTREVRDAENKMIHLAAQGQGKHEALRGVKEWEIRHPLVAASEEQSKAVRHVLASEDFVISFRGPAGAGKTELMSEAVTAIESLSGKVVMLLAPSSPSVEVLRAQGFARADTLQQFELNPELQQAVKGQVLWVDEAGFLSVHQMLELQEFAVEHNCRLVLTGFQIVPLVEDFLKAWQLAQRDGNLVAAAASWYNNQATRREEGVGWRAGIAIWFGDILFSHKYSDEAKRQRAVARRDEWRNTLRKVFQEVDAIALPVLRKAPPKRNLFLTGIFEARFLKIQNTVVVNYAGVPALALPIPPSGESFPVTSI